MMTKRKTRSVADLKLLIIAPLALLLFMVFSCSQENNEPLSQAEPVAQEESVAMEDPIAQEEPVAQAENEIQSEEPVPDIDFRKKESNGRDVFVVVEQMPTFMGGDVNKFREWVQRNVKYPKIAAENGIQGKVFVTYVVNEDGSVSDIEILRGADPVLDNEAIRVVSTSPLWIPGKQGGKTVPVKFSITVNFRLQ